MRVTIDPSWTFDDALAAAWDAYRGAQEFGATNRIRVLEQWGNVVGADRARSDLEDVVARYDTLEEASSRTGLSVYALRKLKKSFNKMPSIPPRPTHRSLFELLKSLGAYSQKEELEMIVDVIPELAACLGYSRHEVFLQPAIGGERYLRADAVLAPEGPNHPRVVIEFKGGKWPERRFSEAISQLGDYCLAAGAPSGLLLSPVRIAVQHDATARTYEVGNLRAEDADVILQMLGKETTAPADTRIVVPKPAEALNTLLEAAAAATTNDEKKNTLENLAAAAFDVHEYVSCKYKNLRTRSSEIDIVGEYRGVPTGRHFLDEYGRYFLVECKNWAVPVGAKEVRDFLGKMRKTRTRLGVLFSRNGITGEEGGTDALREIQAAYDKDGTSLVVVTEPDLHALSNLDEVLNLIDRRLDELRFDV